MRQPIRSYQAVIERSSPIVRTARVMQLESLFDVPPRERSELKWDVDLPLDDQPWNIGLIVGPSGSGKSTIARCLFTRELIHGYTWRADRSIVDDFPADVSIKDITTILSSVGFSSPPSWLRPFNVLSTGEQFRVTVARALCENATRMIVIDEFTSVIDRTVAQIGSAAIAKTVRRRNQQFVAVTCHEDVVPWLQPDWIYTTADRTFAWRSVQPRPAIELVINRAPNAAWKLFAHHHYLTTSLNPSAISFVAFYRDVPVAFDSWLPFFGKLKTSQQARRVHRMVCLPDFQGVGIGNALSSYCASMWAGLGYRAIISTGHPALMAQRQRSPHWRMTRAPATTRRGHHSIDKTRATDRNVASFEYIGPPLDFKTAQRTLNSFAIMQGQVITEGRDG